MSEGTERDQELLAGWLAQTAESERLTARFAALAETLPAGVAVMTRERLLFANRQLHRLLGADAVLALPKLPLARVVPEAHVRARVRAALRRAWDGSAESLGVLVLQRDDGTRLDATVTLRPLPLETEPTLLVVLDEGALSGARPPETPETLRAVGLYLAGLANDLRGPLTAFLGHLALLARRTDLPSDLREAFELYRQVTQETLDRFARAMEWGCRVPLVDRVDLRSVIEAAVATLESEPLPGEADIRVALDLGTTPPVVGNADQLQLAVEHVLRNAREALATRGGTIRVTLRADGGRVRLAVADDGPGIPDSLRPHVFDPFASTKSVTSGRGLGLAIVKDIIGRHRGGIDLDSNPAGTTVAFTFDAVSEAAPAEHPRGRRVLLVEDNPAVRETYRMLLEKARWEVLTAGDADQALDLLARERVDALVVDVQMAGRDGLALVEALATWHPHLLPRVALHTAYAYEDRVQAVAERYGVVLLEKPSPFDRVLATVNALAGAGRDGE